MGWITAIANGIKRAFETTRPVLQSIPPILLMVGVKQRKGLSAICLTSAIINRLPEAEIETGVNQDGSENKVNKLIRIMCEELIKEIKDNAKVTCVIEPTSVNSLGTGANAGGPVVVTSYNTMAVNACGVIQ